MKKITFLLAFLATTMLTMAQMSGIYKVGTAGTPDFTSLSAAVTALNTLGLSGNVVLEITSDITEAANIGLGVNTSGFSIIIRPDADVDRTITFTKTTDNSSPSGHFVIGYTVLTSGWSDANTIATNNVTIDGYSVGGNTRRLKFTTASGSLTASRLIMVIGACQNTTIKNCIVESKSTATSALCIGTIARKLIGTGDVAPNVVIIENNEITSLASVSGQGIMTSSSGTLVSAKTTGLVVKDNIIKAQGRCGWFYYINGASFEGNELHLTQLGSAGTINYGLWTGTGVTGTFEIFKNKILQVTTNESGTSGTLGMRALSLASGGTYNIYNNTFAGMDRKGSATVAVNQTYVFFGGLGYIYHNTFYMPALTAPTTTGYYSAIQLSSANPAIKNNIFISNEDATANAFYSAISTSAIENNVFYHRAGVTNARFVTGTAFTTLGDYQTANPTKDVNSKYADVVFQDAANGDLRLTGSSEHDDHLAVPLLLTEVPYDMFGLERATPYTYAGAHQSVMPFYWTSVETPAATHRIMRTYNGIQVELEGEATVEVYTVNGLLIEKVKTSGTYTRDLNNGVYIVRIDGVATKFIK